MSGDDKQSKCPICNHHWVHCYCDEQDEDEQPAREPQSNSTPVAMPSYRKLITDQSAEPEGY